MAKKGTKALVAVGSNQDSYAGNAKSTLRRAMLQLQQSGCLIRAMSRFFSTPSFPEGFGPDYVNAAFCLDWPDTPRALLNQLHVIEAQFGRERVQRWGQRTLDLDLLAFEDRVVPDAEHVQAWIDLPLAEQMENTPDQLLLPHPRLQDRAFVLVPLLDIAPDWRHPLLGKTVQEMHDALPPEDIASVIPLVNPGNQA